MSSRSRPVVAVELVDADKGDLGRVAGSVSAARLGTIRVFGFRSRLEPSTSRWQTVGWHSFTILLVRAIFSYSNCAHALRQW